MDTIKEALKINKKTAFDCRHKTLSSLQDTQLETFKGITESYETFFRHSKKGQKSDEGFAKEIGLEHYRLGSDFKHHVKQRVYHIQHVNSTHSKLKKCLDSEFRRIPTKYLQQYLN